MLLDGHKTLELPSIQPDHGETHIKSPSELFVGMVCDQVYRVLHKYQVLSEEHRTKIRITALHHGSFDFEFLDPKLSYASRVFFGDCGLVAYTGGWNPYNWLALVEGEDMADDVDDV